MRQAPQALIDQAREAAVERARQTLAALIAAYETARAEQDLPAKREQRIRLQDLLLEAAEMDGATLGWVRRLVMALIHHIGVWRDLSTAPPFVRAEVEVLLEGQIQLLRKVFRLEG